jgi:hypothetical protein
MPFLLMNLSPSLVHLFEAVKNSFPPDERHGGHQALSRSVSEASALSSSGYTSTRKAASRPKAQRSNFLLRRERSPSFHNLEGGKPYTPHVSIAYLHMTRTDLMNEEVCGAITQANPGIMSSVRAIGLSAWWTEGGAGDWVKICEVKLGEFDDQVV